MGKKNKKRPNGNGTGNGPPQQGVGDVLRQPVPSPLPQRALPAAPPPQAALPAPVPHAALPAPAPHAALPAPAPHAALPAQAVQASLPAAPRQAAFPTAGVQAALPAAPPPARGASGSPDMFQILKPDGTLVPGSKPLIDDATLLKIHDTMRLVRALDERMITLQRQGRAGFYGSCLGEEAAVLGSAAALRPADWIVPALRQNAAMLFRGFSLTAYISQVLGNSGDVMKARQMPSHHASPSVRQVSWSSCIANQLMHAVGIAKSISVQRKDEIAVGYVGDGGTSEGDFHVAMNLAGLWRPPLVLVCQNNQWAISVPLERQTLVTRIADKASAYGLPGLRVDGNDVLAVHAAMTEAAERARSGGGATLLELYTYRVGAHSTSDDPSRYRDEAITERWKQLDPVARLETYLEKRGLRSAKDVEALKQRCIAEVAAAVDEAEAMPPVAHETLIEDVYATPPESLMAQWREWKDLPVTKPHA